MEEEAAAYVDTLDNLIINTPRTSLEMPRKDLSLHGLHNLYNSMAAGLSACLLNIRKEDIRRALEDFEGVEHRLEFVADIDGVRYINDSKATNVNSCWYALESMPPGGNVILILGGKDKGNDYSEIEPLVRDKVKAIVAMGLHNEKIVEFFGGKVPVIRDTHSLQDAVDACAALATAGDTVLLSPCCASFDLFRELRRPRTSVQRCGKSSEEIIPHTSYTSHIHTPGPHSNPYSSPAMILDNNTTTTESTPSAI